MNLRGNRNWFSAALMTLVIYAMAPVAGHMRDYLSMLGILKITVVMAVLSVSAIGIYISPVEWRKLGRWTVITAGLAFLAFIITIVVTKYPAEAVHLAEYCLLAMLLFDTLAPESGGEAVATLKTLLLVATIGWGDEMIQWYLPDRYYDNGDILMNLAGGLCGSTLVWLYRKERILFSNSDT